MTALDRLESGLGRALEWIVLTLLGALAGVVVVGVGFRKAGAALVWYDEVASVLLAWVTYYGACLAALRRDHIGFPQLVRRLSGRGWLVVAAVRETFVVGFFALATWAGWVVLVVLEGDSLISLPWVPARLTQSVIPVGGALFIVAELLAFRRELRDRDRDGSASAATIERSPAPEREQGR